MKLGILFSAWRCLLILLVFLLFVPLAWGELQVTIFPDNSAENPITRKYAIFQVSGLRPSASWIKVERVDQSGNLFGESPQWHHKAGSETEVEFPAKLPIAWSGEIFEQYYRVSEWSDLEILGGQLVNGPTPKLNIVTHHAFSKLRLNYSVNCDNRVCTVWVDPVVAPEQASSVQLYAWALYAPQYDDNGALKVYDGTPIPAFKAITPFVYTDYSSFTFSYNKCGLFYLGLYQASNGQYSNTNTPTLGTGLGSMPAPLIQYQGSEYMLPLALIVPGETADGCQAPELLSTPNFSYPEELIIVADPVPGDWQVSSVKQAITVFNGSSFYLPVGKDFRGELEVDVPAGLVVKNDRTGYLTVSQVEGDDILPGYVRYLLRRPPGAAWGYNAPIHFQLNNASIIGSVGQRLRVRPVLGERRADMWQEFSLRITEAPSCQPLGLFNVGLTWSDQNLFSPSQEGAIAPHDYFSIYRSLGFNAVPRNGSHYYDPAIPSAAAKYFLPSARLVPQWEGLRYDIEHSTFGDDFDTGPGTFELLKYSTAQVSGADLSAHGLSNPEEERRQWLNAASLYEQTDGDVIDLAYRGLWYQKAIANLVKVVEAVQPDGVSMDIEDGSFPSEAAWRDAVINGLSANALEQRLPGESLSELAHRTAKEWLGGLASAVRAVSPNIELGFYGAACAYHNGYGALRTDMFGDLNVICEPSMYAFQANLEHLSRETRRISRTLGSSRKFYPTLTFGQSNDESRPADRYFDVVAHTLLSGASGFRVYMGSVSYDDPGEVLAMSQALKAIRRYEEVAYFGQAREPEEFGTFTNAIASPRGDGQTSLIALSPRTQSEPMRAQIDRSGSGAMFALDLRTGMASYFESGMIDLTLAATQGTVLLVVPESLADLNENGTLDIYEDNDGDGLLNGDERHLYHTDENNADTDADGLPDGWEVNWGTDPRIADSSGNPDEDCLTNIQEYELGSHPKNAYSRSGALKDGCVEPEPPVGNPELPAPILKLGPRALTVEIPNYSSLGQVTIRVAIKRKARISHKMRVARRQRQKLRLNQFKPRDLITVTYFSTALDRESAASKIRITRAVLSKVEK